MMENGKFIRRNLGEDGWKMENDNLKRDPKTKIQSN